jgi:hypothetical protein
VSSRAPARVEPPLQVPPVVVPESPPGIGRESQMQGSIGTRVVRAVFGEETAAGSAQRGILLGSYRALGDTSDHLLTTLPVEVEADSEATEATEPPPMGMEEPDPSFPCFFEERTDGKVTGSVDAKCTKTKDPYDLSNNPEESLTIDGTWTAVAGGPSQQFFLQSIPNSSSLLDELLPSILAYSRATHECAPYVRIRDTVASVVPRRSWHTYSTHWHCEEPRVEHTLALLTEPLQFAKHERPPAPTTLGFLAEFTDEAPRQMTFGPIDLGGIGSDTALHIQDLEQSLGDAHLYLVYTESINEPGPTAVRCCWRSRESRNWLLAVSPDGSVSPLLQLPDTSATTGMGCFDTSTELEVVPVALDGKAPLEIIVTTTVKQKQQQAAPPGSPPGVWSICVDLPDVQKRQAWHYDRAKRQFQKISLSKAALEGALKRSKPILQH